MLYYFGYLLFPCLTYQPILGQCFLSLPQGHIGKTRGFLPFSRGVEKEYLPELVDNIVVVSLFCSHFTFCFVFLLSILKGPILPWDKIISRFLHLNKICDSMVLEQVSFRFRYQNVPGKSQKEEEVRLLIYNHLVFFDKYHAFVEHLFCLANDGLFLNTNTIADACKAQSKYMYIIRVSFRVSNRCSITPKITLAH